MHQGKFCVPGWVVRRKCCDSWLFLWHRHANLPSVIPHVGNAHCSQEATHCPQRPNKLARSSPLWRFAACNSAPEFQYEPVTSRQLLGVGERGAISTNGDITPGTNAHHNITRPSLEKVGTCRSVHYIHLQNESEIPFTWITYLTNCA